MDDDDESEQVERVVPTGAPDKAQVRVRGKPRCKIMGGRGVGWKGSCSLVLSGILCMSYPVIIHCYYYCVKTCPLQ